MSERSKPSNRKTHYLHWALRRSCSLCVALAILVSFSWALLEPVRATLLRQVVYFSRSSLCIYCIVPALDDVLAFFPKLHRPYALVLERSGIGLVTGCWPTFCPCRIHCCSRINIACSDTLLRMLLFGIVVMPHIWWSKVWGCSGITKRLRPKIYISNMPLISFNPPSFTMLMPFLLCSFCITLLAFCSLWYILHFFTLSLQFFNFIIH